MDESGLEESKLDLSLVKFLEDSKARGEFVSEGAFTVSLEKAHSKQRGFRFPRDSAWISKLVQAAVVMSCETFELQEGPMFLRVFLKFTAKSQTPDGNTLVKNLLEPTAQKEDALMFLALALRFVVEKEGFSFIIFSKRGEELSHPIYAGSYFEGLHPEKLLAKLQNEESGLHILLSRSSKRAALGKFLRFWQTSKIREELLQFCYACPIAIRYNGKLINGQLDSRQPAKGKLEGLGFKEFGKCGTSDSRLAFLPDLELNSALAQSVSSQENASIFLGYRPEQSGILPYQNLSKIFWLRHGVVVDEVALDYPTKHFFCLFFLDARGLKSDLTGFQLIRNSVRGGREKSSVESLSAALAKISLETILLVRGESREFISFVERERLGLANFTTPWVAEVIESRQDPHRNLRHEGDEEWYEDWD